MQNYIQTILDSIDEEKIAEDTLNFLKVKSETGDEKKGCDLIIKSVNKSIRKGIVFFSK